MRAVERTDGLGSGLPTKIKAFYGMGQVGNQLFRDAPMILLLYYLTSIMGIPPALAGAAIFIPKVAVGVLADFSVGVLSDRNLHRFPRRNWLLLGAVLAPLAMVASFFVPDADTTTQMAYVVLGFGFYMAVFAVFSVPFLAHFSEISSDPQERTVLMAWKHAWTGVGLLLGSAAVPWLIHELGSDRTAYVTGAAVLGFVTAISLITAWSAVRNVAVTVVTQEPLTMKALLDTLTFKPFRILCTSAAAMTISQGTCSAAMVFFITYNMGREDALAQLGILVAIAGAVVMTVSPLWVAIAKRVGKRNAYLLGAVGHFSTLLIWAAVADGPIWVTYICSAFVGLFNSGWGLIALSLLTDAMSDAREQTGRDTAGACAAIWSIIEKVGIATGGTLVIGAILTIGGFDSAAAKAGVEQSAMAVDSIRFGFAVVPAIFMATAACIIWRYVPKNSGAPIAH